MLQQTQASRVVPAYRAFLRRFPSVRALAEASRRDVLLAWDGLGYNRRAVALAEAARVVVREHAGCVPSDPVSLRRLPGVGPYTAAAVASLAFGLPIAAVDTNVRRIVARVFEGTEADEVGSARIGELAGSWVDASDPGAWNQALMDLGREVCRPSPRCEVCPLAPACRFRALGAEPRPSRHRQGPFEGSSRQIRGAVVRVLRGRRSVRLHDLPLLAGFPSERVSEAVERLVADGLVEVRRGRVGLVP
jgi:A/G-specific adenine glycosylase